MLMHSPMSRAAIAALVLAASLNCVAIHAQADFVTTVVSTHPIAYYRLDASSGKSQAGATTYKPVGAVAIAAPGAPTGATVSKFAKLDGSTAYFVTTQAGGITTAASIMAWVNLAELPSRPGRFFYVAGESESGNDLDLQFETDNALRFYTAGGGNLSYAAPPASLVNQWHLIFATLDTVSGARAIYWDGKPVATDKGGGRPGKTSAFNIGYSIVFPGRFFHGGIQDVALWNRVLKPNEVAAIYSASQSSAFPPVAPPPPPSAGPSAPLPATGPFATTAKVEIEDANGPVQLRREEQIAYMFLSAIEIIEHNCQLTLQHVCPMNQILSGSYPNGANIEHLKFDPNKTDPNYVYTLAASGMAWEAHANPKRPGLKGFCFMARNVGTTTATYNPAGSAGWVDKELGNRGMEGDSFAIQ
ncbi:MAG: LamG domain-containing protein [Terracidiphilus sp.]